MSLSITSDRTITFHALKEKAHSKKREPIRL